MDKKVALIANTALERVRVAYKDNRIVLREEAASNPPFVQPRLSPETLKECIVPRFADKTEATVWTRMITQIRLHRPKNFACCRENGGRFVAPHAAIEDAAERVD